jgi:phosphoribosylamine--glycine ligase
LADSVRQAQQKAYHTASTIAFDGMQMRRDIGYRAIKN